MSEPSDVQQRTSWAGRRLRVTVGPIAHGGHCVARFKGRVIFVRHAIPGEDVVVEITEDRSESFCRADAVEILSPSPDRVTPPCRYAHPGGCGGCDFQHVATAAQRGFKADVIAEQFERLAGVQVEVQVERLEPEDLGWRRRIRWAVSPAGRLGLRVHRSHEVLPIEECLIAAPQIRRPPVTDERWSGAVEAEAAVDDDGRVATLALREPARRTGGRNRHGSRRERRTVLTASLMDGPDRLNFRASGRDYRVAPGGFWQTHPGAAQAFLDTVLAATDPGPGDRVLDLYAGTGLFTAPLALAVAESGRVLGIEGDRTAASDGAANLRDLPWSELQVGAVTAETIGEAGRRLGSVDIVILDPPRTGAGRAVVQAVLALQPRVVCYVACDPAALARDVATAREAGWEMSGIRAFDAFPMTHHVECIATLTRRGS